MLIKKKNGKERDISICPSKENRNEIVDEEALMCVKKRAMEE